VKTALEVEGRGNLPFIGDCADVNLGSRRFLEICISWKLPWLVRPLEEVGNPPRES
jgi:hypothetical protein